MKYINKLVQILDKNAVNIGLYCISNDKDKIIAGEAAAEFFLCPHKKGGWRVYLMEFGRGVIYQDYHLDTEREACIKFIEISECYYHLSKYLNEFE